jgi:hypothetical protein
LGGALLADVAIYYDKRSLYLPSESGTPIAQLRSTPRSAMPHRDGVLGWARVLREAHVPYGVVTNATLDQLERYRAVVLPSVLELSAEQAARFRDFVEGGGVLYASGPTSLDRRHPGGARYLLEDVLGVRYAGTLGSTWTYLTPATEGATRAIAPQDHLAVNGPMVRAAARDGAEVRYTATLPLTRPEAGTAVGSRFASIHSNPPAPQPGESPGLIVNRFGRGAAIWCAAPIETSDEPINAALLAGLLREQVEARGGPYRIEVDAHPSVEATLFGQPERRRWLVGLANLETRPPQGAVDATVRLRLSDGATVARVVRAPDLTETPYEREGDTIRVLVPDVGVLTMLLVDFT